MKSSLEAWLEEFSKNNTMERQLRRYFCAVLEQLFKYTSLETLDNVFREIQVIREL